MAVTPYRLTRVVRTLTSEVYLIWEDSRRVGQVDIHYADDIIHATMLLEEDLDKDLVDQLVKQLDRDIVASFLQDFERENLLVTVCRGNELYTYSDEDGDDDNDEVSW